MTTTVKVHVNGDYITTVRTVNMKTGTVSEQEISGVGVEGGKEEVIQNQHPTDIQMTITERYAPRTQPTGETQD